jgi:hypothetical protein
MNDVGSNDQQGDDVAHLRRQLRVVAILASAEAAGIAPLPSAHLHTIAYFADALAPVWGLRILDAQLLKRKDGPMSPVLQQDVDRLVGRGVVVPLHVRHVEGADGRWSLDACYALNAAFGGRITDAVGRYPEQAEQLEFVTEVVHALAALGPWSAKASSSDAAYADEVIDYGNVVDIETLRSGVNLTARVALRIGHVMKPQAELSPAELVHLYVREVYTRLSGAVPHR